MFKEIAKKNQEVVLFGASAGVFEGSADVPDNMPNLFYLDVNNYNEQQYILGEHIHTHGIVIVVFSGADLHVQGDYVLGWKPIGKELTLTEIQGVNCVARLNDMPATEVYRHYLQVTPDENFVFNISEFPLVIERNGCLIARVPPVYDKEGRTYFNGDVYKGEKARLSYAVHAELLKETDEASKKLCGFAPEGIFISVCGNRSLFLRGAAEKELDYYRRFSPDLIANYGTAEIYSYQGKGGILNSALVSVAFREGPYKAIGSCNNQILDEETHFIIPLAARMAAFLDAVTQELAESNEELKAMARTAELANQAKSNFLSNMSHEIRTPINAVLGMDEMILRECKDPVICEYAENIKTAGNNLLGLINDIIPEWLKAVPGLDVEAGIKHCGGVKEYLNAFTVFAGSLSVIANELEIYYDNKSCKNYTTKVHALKSTARVAGFAELSDRARRLEDAGNNGYVNEIITDTPVLLNLCRDYANMLAPLLEQPESDSSAKSPISAEELADAWESLKEVVQSFDYDSLNYILDELSGYELPEQDAETLQAIQAAAINLDWERIHKLLDEK